MATTAMQDAAAEIALAARTAIRIAGLDVEAAIDDAALMYIEEAHLARTRGRHWARESTTEQIDAARFRGSVASDTRDNTPRPSTGPMRDYVRNLVEASL
ncbi:hypothetical protein [Mycobacteroides salmoniphilum]|uniref:hypothetical protein n=1 Tax=Mycobacteroides salmoniphilum TaxID=404941 RepID=UPI0011179D78|nr:hypothetical protein [Mycobacteroides salmoniphilum]